VLTVEKGKAEDREAVNIRFRGTTRPTVVVVVGAVGIA